MRQADARFGDVTNGTERIAAGITGAIGAERLPLLRAPPLGRRVPLLELAPRTAYGERGGGSRPVPGVASE